MQNMRIILSAAVTVIFAVTVANAHQITFDGLDYSKTVQITHNGTNLNVYAGSYIIHVDGVQERAFCVDLDHWIKNAWTADFAPVTTVNGGLAAAYLYDHFASAVSTNTAGAALQIAIWKVVEDYGSTMDLSAGQFRFNGDAGVRTAANNLLASLPSSLDGYSTSAYVIASGNCPRSQNLIVPEPGTLILAVVSVMSMMVGRRVRPVLAR